MKYVLSFLIAFAVCGVMYGLNILLQNRCYKRKLFWLQGFCMPLVGLVFAIVLMLWSGMYPFAFKTLADFRLWVIGTETVVIAWVIVLLAKRSPGNENPLVIRCIEAATIFESISSFVFSIGIGYVFMESGCFVIPMVAHAAERFVSGLFEKRMFGED